MVEKDTATKLSFPSNVHMFSQLLFFLLSPLVGSAWAKEVQPFLISRIQAKPFPSFLMGLTNWSPLLLPWCHLVFHFLLSLLWKSFPEDRSACGFSPFFAVFSAVPLPVCPPRSACNSPFKWEIATETFVIPSCLHFILAGICVNMLAWSCTCKWSGSFYQYLH